MSDTDLDIAERALLGAVMRDGNAAEIATCIVRPCDFFDPRHELIAEAAWDIAEEGGGRPDYVRVVDWLKRQAKLVAAGGATYVGTIDDPLPDVCPANVRHYAEAVKRAAVLRAMQEGYADLCDESLPLEERMASMRRRLDEMTTTGPCARWLDSIAAEHAEMSAAGAMERCFPLGLGAIDDLVRVQKGHIVILAGGAKSGKTALALQIVRSIAETQRVLYVTLEMPAVSDLHTRQLMSETGCALEVVAQPPQHLAAKVAEARATLSQLKLAVVDRSPMTVERVAVEARAIPGLSAIVVDYLQLLTPSTRRKGESREQEVAGMSRGLKELAMSLRVPIFVLSQLSRLHLVEDRAPNMHDLRESGAIEQDANTIVMIGLVTEKRSRALAQKLKSGEITPEWYADRMADRQLYLRANRMGETGFCRATWDRRHQRFVNVRLPKEDETE